MITYIDLICTVCKNSFIREKKYFTYEFKKNINYSPLCSEECKKNFKNKKQTVICAQCNISFIKKNTEIKKSKNNFCSTNCSAKFNNHNRFNKKIKYCTVCNVEFYAAINAYKNFICFRCSSLFLTKRIIRAPKIIGFMKISQSNCIDCNKIIYYKKYGKLCRHKMYVNLGKRIGKLSAAKQVKRSRNEMYFAELCSKYFTKIGTNEAIFKSKYGNWDADVIIYDYKIAVLWNGIWHYKKVRAKHSLAQVQSRDKIKQDVIIDNLYMPYIIKDMGKFNKNFVENEFNIFIKYVLTV